MKRIASLASVLVLMLLMCAGLCSPVSAAGYSEAGGTEGHGYTSPGYIYREDSKISNLRCVIPEFQISETGNIRIDFGGVSVYGNYTATRFNYSYSYGTAGTITGTSLGGLGNGTGASRSGSGWRININASTSSLPTSIPAPYNNFGSLTLAMTCEIRDSGTFPKTEMSVNNTGVLTTSAYPCVNVARTVDYTLGYQFTGAINSSDESLTVNLSAESQVTGRMQLSPSQQTTSTAQATYYSTSGMSVTATRSRELSNTSISVSCSRPLTTETVAATCTQDGYVIKSCECGYYEKKVIKTNGHSWYPGTVVNPTCDEKGYTIYNCENCSETWKGAYSAALGHTEISIPGKSPTATEPGLTEGKKCSVCGKILVAQEIIPVCTYTVAGTVTSFNSNTDDVIIRLMKGGETEAAYTVTVQGNSAAYSINGVAPGTYTMKVSKAKHAAREYAITVASTNVTQNAEIWLHGDVTGDGMVNTADATQINRYFSGKSSVFGSGDSASKNYRLLVANVYSTDNTLNTTDATQIKRHFSGKTSIFNTLC